jgi:hypothetical protein
MGEFIGELHDLFFVNFRRVSSATTFSRTWFSFCLMDSIRDSPFADHLLRIGFDYCRDGAALIVLSGV